MIKSISFLPEFIDLVRTGEKTVTRRIKTNLKPGDICYFKAGRTGKKEGYIKIIEVTLSKLKMVNIPYYKEEKYQEYNREGFYNPMSYMLNFIDTWNKLHKEMGSRWKDNPEVKRIEFEYIGEKL